MNSKPLDGLLVVSLEQALAAPLCSCRLADAGARVIKIERQSGDFARNYDSAVNGESSYFVWANRGKESVVLDLKTDTGISALHDILKKADVFIQNLIPGATGRLGLDANSLHKRYPQLIVCDISGYGETGTYADMKAYDLLIQSESGLVAVSGGKENYGRIGVSICDIGAGMTAFEGVLLALAKRRKTGHGSNVKVSLFDVAAEWMSVPILHQRYTGQSPERVGLTHPSIAPYGGYTTHDNKTIVISIQNEREWSKFCCECLGVPELSCDPRFINNNARVKNRTHLDHIISEFCKQKSMSELKERFIRVGIAFGVVNLPEDLINHPQLRSINIKTTSGEVETVAPPIIFKNENINFGAVPSLGEHTGKVLAEFSLTS